MGKQRTKPEDRKDSRASLQMPVWLRARIDAHAARLGLSRSAVFRELLEASVSAWGVPVWMAWEKSGPPIGRHGHPLTNVTLTMTASQLARLDRFAAFLEESRDDTVTLMWGGVTRSDAVRLLIARTLFPDGTLTFDVMGKPRERKEAA